MIATMPAQAPQLDIPRPPAATATPIVYSLVAPVFNEAETLRQFYSRAMSALEDLEQPFELLLVNDGSSDGSDRIMRELQMRDSRVRVIELSRNFGHQAAITAGLAQARGQAVIIIDSDLQDPPELILEMAERWKEGLEVVYAQRAARAGETRFKLFTAALFYRLIGRLTDVNIPRDTGDFRLLDRKVVDALVELPEKHRFMRGLSAWVGFRQGAVRYERAERYAGSTKYPLRKMLRFAMDAVTGFSYMPLQLATSLGFSLAGLSLLAILVTALLRLVAGVVVAQATALMLALLLGGIQLIFLGVIGEYLGRIYDEVRQRPLYIVRDVLESPVKQ